MRRRVFTTEEFVAEGGTWGQLRSDVAQGRRVRIEHRVYADGPDEPDDFEKALARVLASKKTAWGEVAAVLHGLDGVKVTTVPARRRTAPMDSSVVTVQGVECTSVLQTLIDLAECVDDLVWEQALECALRRRAVDIDDIAALLPAMSKSRRHGVGRIRRVLALRPIGAPPTESLLETLMVQIIRTIPGLPPPVRQYRVVNRHGSFVARVDLCWPELGLFIELDGMQQAGQPVYDAARQTAVTAASGWLCGRYTWRQVTATPKSVARELTDLVEQCRRRLPATV
ncbi:MAG: hypothetical protein QOJ00_2131 [Actinomycetota bacterium]|jgi:hypothetical protein